MPTKQPSIRTRFAPSPTGFIHLGNIRSALYPWAFARANHGKFILRIEDTDEARSTQEAVDVINDSLNWLGLTPDEGPFYQMQRMARYKEVIKQLLDNGWVYPCYMSVQELDSLRQKQMLAKQKPRYDGTWRPEAGKILPPVPNDVQPVLRFKNPQTGSVSWDDKVKGYIEISNEELDDLVIARAAPFGEIGTPTYNFCVVVDDIDMHITHVIRGDDHVNNTPRQINIFRALGYEPPIFAHLPTVLNESGEKMSKRDPTTKSVKQYREEGFLPDAIVNYLARLGWSHGDDEIFSRAQLVKWFDLEHLGKSAAQFDETKLRWVNAQHLKTMSGMAIAPLVVAHLVKDGITIQPHAADDLEHFAKICDLFKDRCDTTQALAQWVKIFYKAPELTADDLAHNVPKDIWPALSALTAAFNTCPWTKEGIASAFKQTLGEYHLKMPQLAMPVRFLIMGITQTPSVDAVLALFSREEILKRLHQP